MKDKKKALISPDASIRKTIHAIDDNALQIAVVVDCNNRLLGTVTDGDVRRAILSGVSLDAPVTQIMNTNPYIVRPNESRENIIAIMKSKCLHQLPVVDDDGILVGLEIVDEIIQRVRRDNVVVLMAGGIGSRLKPLTNECPKPLLKVGTKPVLETILIGLMEYGFSRFYISVNYKAKMIEEYLKDGKRWGVDISYLHENDRMGTAGALGLLPDDIMDPILVVNGDLLTRINYSHLLSYHIEQSAKATMCIREYDHQIPYGVVKVDKHNLVGIQEKPSQRHFITAGIYVLNPDVLEMIPKNTYIDMPELFELLMRKRVEPAVFPIREYWRDIGHMGDFEKANIEYGEHF